MKNAGFQTESGMTREGLDSRLHGNDSGGGIAVGSRFRCRICAGVLGFLRDNYCHSWV